ncbi:ATP-binding protein [Blautia wexlerae]|uniref:ATP-binding protein n=1 Tax=Blautia wexlerae TaxID=418240 RepID=UPI00321B325E
MILLLRITKQNGGRKIARKLRDWYPGAIYHIMHRGVRRKPIFEDEMDHQVLLQIIKTSLSKYNCWLHAYCLMTNHVHLLIETGDIEIGKFMKYMSECYAIYYNHKYGYRGHVFESRYKSCLVKEDAYFLQTSRYIHLNPVKAQMADYPEDHLWSSYRTMIGIADDGITEKKKTLLDFKDVKGQDELIEAVVLAAAGGHNMLMVGEPGCGKTMIAQRIPTILPEMTEEECLEVTKIYSISGLLPNGHALMKYRPFRAPHHNASLNALIGGGANAMPGEVSLAHNGVLFLDELAEFSRRTLDALRQPIEDKKVSISRVNGTHTFPSNFMFITAMNPCPCGYYPSAKCKCTDYEIVKYRGKISGPIMDRIDIQKEVHPVDFFAIADQKPCCSSEELRIKVKKPGKYNRNGMCRKVESIVMHR